MVTETSQRIPRLVNQICDRALLIGYAKGLDRIDGPCVKEAARELGWMEGCAPFGLPRNVRRNLAEMRTARPPRGHPAGAPDSLFQDAKLKDTPESMSNIFDALNKQRSSAKAKESLVPLEAISRESTMLPSAGDAERDLEMERLRQRILLEIEPATSASVVFTGAVEAKVPPRWLCFLPVSWPGSSRNRCCWWTPMWKATPAR
ncbi:MAG: hypothetical protein R3E12_08320 [Candidatus Eisenbacteria bacterium]